jgi:hypothetical protein
MLASVVMLALGSVQPNCLRNPVSAIGDATASRSGCIASAKPERTCLRKLDEGIGDLQKLEQVKPLAFQIVPHYEVAV